ncbi:MAG: GGDEF domain-containing protein, partial [Candidatus Protistobacter heckmanni]|nr:GGDEF domain-containing protein [Candidatus Protistobacter heckmanni]
MDPAAHSAVQNESALYALPSVAHVTLTPLARSAALTVAALLLALGLGAIPFARAPLPVVQPFLPMFGMAVFIVEGLTAYLLMLQFLSSGQLFIGVLAAAYGFTAPVVMLQMLVFPGVFSETGLLGAGPQTAVWLWAIWHGGFPTIVALAMLTMRVEPRLRITPARAKPLAKWVVSAPLAAALLAGYVTIVHGDSLPPLVRAGSYLGLASSPAGMYVIAAHVAAMAAVLVIGRNRSVLMMWLAVGLLASCLDISLTLAAGARYSLGWYASRCLAVFGALAVLAVTLWEITKLYARVSAANAQLRDLASHDGLTGLYNRRHLNLKLQEHIAQSSRDGRSLSLILLDIDYFKRFNDANGHLEGDRCLTGVAHALQAMARRPYDVAERFGGEEFALVLPGASQRAGQRVAEELRARIEALRIPAAPSGSGQPPVSSWVTASLGVATLLSGGRETPEQLVHRADAALYEAKARGRNCVVASMKY